MPADAKRRRLSEDGQFEVTKSTGTEVFNPQTAQPVSPQKDQRRTLFVRPLAASVSTERLTDFFSQSHPLKHATVVLDPQTKTSKGFGFVTFADPEDAEAAAAELNNANLDGRKIKIEVADPRHRDVQENGGRSQPSSKALELKAEREKNRVKILPPKLIVRNLPWGIKEPQDLAVHFKSYGKVKHASVPKQSPKVQSGFGFVVLKGRKNAEKAIAGVNGKVVDGRPLAVDWAVDKDTWEKMLSGEQNAEDREPDILGGTTGANSAKNNLSATGDEVKPSSEADEDEDTASASDEVDGSSDALNVDKHMEDVGSKNSEYQETPSTTIFIRNLPFTCTDDMLHTHFSHFGAVRYARVVFDHDTERSRGTGFVCFFNVDAAKSCVKNAPKNPSSPSTTTLANKKRKGETLTHSVLQNEAADPSRRYTLEGRILQVSKALSKSDATRREAEGSLKREMRDRDTRRLYLLSEGTISKGSKLYEKLGPTEINIREASAKQRQKLIRTNPSLHMSLTRLSVRNIPRSITSKDLKALAREAVVGFAVDVKNGLRQPLSKEELSRAAHSMKEAEKLRKQQRKGIVKQAKIVFEGHKGAKVDEKSGAGRSRGYGFIEYISHRSALMGLRWLNGHAVKAGDGERNKRLIVEFAIENAQVVSRRNDREAKTRIQQPHAANRKTQPGNGHDKVAGKKRKRDDVQEQRAQETMPKRPSISADEKNKMAKRNRIISKKRNMRNSRRAG